MYSMDFVTLNIFVQTERGTIDQLLSAISDSFSYSYSLSQAMNLAL
jgi:hypothetical protein